MKKQVTKAIPLNEVTTPLKGEPDYRRRAIIKALWNKEKIPVGEIIYEHFWNEEFQYIIKPYWGRIDRLEDETPGAFHGIPGIDMDCRYEAYYRVNRTPSFIIQRTPPKNRVDMMELMNEVGLNHYDAFEWLIRTKTRASQDNLILEEPLDNDSNETGLGRLD